MENGDHELARQPTQRMYHCQVVKYAQSTGPKDPSLHATRVPILYFTPRSRRATIDTPTRGWDECVKPRYPNLCVELVGRDGNAFSILARVRRALREVGVSDEELRLFVAEATQGNYDHLLATVARWVEVT